MKPQRLRNKPQSAYPSLIHSGQVSHTGVHISTHHELSSGLCSMHVVQENVLLTQAEVFVIKAIKRGLNPCHKNAYVQPHRAEGAQAPSGYLNKISKNVVDPKCTQWTKLKENLTPPMPLPPTWSSCNIITANEQSLLTETQETNWKATFFIRHVILFLRSLKHLLAFSILGGGVGGRKWKCYRNDRSTLKFCFIDPLKINLIKT